MADIKSETIPGGRPGSGAHRVVALCGPYLSGKTSLLESILYATGAIGRRGSTRAGTSIGDSVVAFRLARPGEAPTLQSRTLDRPGGRFVAASAAIAIALVALAFAMVRWVRRRRITRS